MLTAAIARWRSEVAQLDKRRETVAEKIGAAEKLLALISSEPQLSLVVGGEPPGKDTSQPTLFSETPPWRRIDLPADVKWIDAIRTWISAAPLGVTHPELRAQIDAHPALSTRFTQSDKGYYGSIARLAAKREIIKHNGRLFTPDAFERFKGEVAAGKVEDEPPVTTAHSPMGEAILDIVGRSAPGGILGKDIINELRRDPEFNAALTPHHTGAYNIIARLVKRNQILRRDDGLCLPGIKFPPRSPVSRWVQGSGAKIPM